jgi:hypothetical protein
LVGLIGLLVNGGTAYRALFQTDELAAQIRKMLSDPNDPLRKQFGNDFKPEDVTPERVKQGGNMLALFAVQNLLIVLGAVSMLSLRFRGLALLGCVLAILDLSFACCLLGAPIGLWALIKLLDPQIRSLFK